MRWLALLFLALPVQAQITAATFSSTSPYPYRYNSGYSSKWILGDRWITAWAADGTIFTTTDDTNSGWQGGTSGGRNILFSSLTNATSTTTGTLVNSMDGFGGFTQGGCGASGTFKSYGLTSISGTLYMFVACDVYNHSTAPYVETVSDSQLLKSTDAGGTWSPQPPSTGVNYASPMFSGTTFPAPMFVNYGQDGACNGADDCSTQVYAVSNDGAWNNGNKMILGRVAKSAIANQSASDWKFYQGGTCTDSANWTSSAATAASLIASSYKVSMAGVQYIPDCGAEGGCYLMMEWYYPSVPTSFVTTDTWWDLYQAPSVCGPWTKFQSTEWNPKGYYNPQPIPSSVSGSTFTLTTTGDFTSQDPATGLYTLTLIPVTLTVTPTPPPAYLAAPPIGVGVLNP